MGDPEIGASIIGEHKDPLLEQARVMALSHHERWDGTGYPKKLKGNEIPAPGLTLPQVFSPSSRPPARN